MKPETVDLNIKVIPSSSRDSIAGWLGDSLKIKVRAPPEKGRANKAVIGLLAKQLDISTKDITLVSGQTSGLKRLAISVLTRDEVLARLPRRE